MSLSQEAMELAQAIGQDVLALKESLGDTSQLNTGSKTLAGALEELQAEFQAIQSDTSIIES